MRRVEAWLLTIGWVGAILFPLVGIIAGVYIGTAKATDDEGLRVTKYDRWSRQQAIPMVAVALLIIVVGFVYRMRHR